MGALTAAGSLSRVLGPIFVTFVYQELGTYFTFGLVTLSMVITLITTLVLWRRLVPLRIAGMEAVGGGSGSGSGSDAENPGAESAARSIRRLDSTEAMERMGR